jgi:hypothetical protein
VHYPSLIGRPEQAQHRYFWLASSFGRNLVMGLKSGLSHDCSCGGVGLL